MTAPARPVVVGTDGSPPSARAVSWAADAAVRRGAPLTVVRAWDVDALAALSPFPPGADDLAALDDLALRQAEEAAAAVRRPGLAVHAVAARGRAPQVLADVAQGAALLVVARRGEGRVRALLGSTASSVLREAPCPVAVVPDREAAGPVVVGWDGSEAADRAVAWAAEEARTRDVGLEVVFAWQMTSLHSAVTSDLAAVPPVSEFERVARECVARPVGAARAGGARASGRAVHGVASRVLVEVAGAAGLVVVGSRGLGGFAALVLGSTSEQVVRHAGAPVVVVRGAGDPVEQAEG